MIAPQVGIFAEGDPAHSYLELALKEGASAHDAVRAIADLHDPRRTIEGVNLVVGFRPELWRNAVTTDALLRATSFQRDIVGPDGYTIPATQADIFVWLAGASYDAVFDVATATVDQLAPVATVVRELAGWTYQRNRDLTGFQDGTENPDLITAPSIVLIPEGEPGAGGSNLLFQQWRHDSATWRSLSTEAQELVIGRTKTDSIEFPEGRMPNDSHVTRNTLVEDGKEFKIFRRNVAYGTVTDHGTIFVGFAKDQHRLQRMLERMAGVGDGIRDALTLYTTALTSSYYFIPALSVLAGLATPQSD